MSDTGRQLWNKAMSNLKTKPTKASVLKFLKAVENEQRRKDALSMLELMQNLTKREAVMWGSSLVGFGSYHYKYASGREGDWLLTGFSPRKNDLTVYIMNGFSAYPDLMKRLGKYKTGKSCLYIKKLEDIDLKVLSQLILKSLDDMSKLYDCK
jgi:hypothetical protein